jgi:hypothetical protein
MHAARRKVTSISGPEALPEESGEFKALIDALDRAQARVLAAAAREAVASAVAEDAALGEQAAPEAGAGSSAGKADGLDCAGGDQLISTAKIVDVADGSTDVAEVEMEDASRELLAAAVDLELSAAFSILPKSKTVPQVVSQAANRCWLIPAGLKGRGKVQASNGVVKSGTLCWLAAGVKPCDVVLVLLGHDPAAAAPARSSLSAVEVMKTFTWRTVTPIVS